MSLSLCLSPGCTWSWNVTTAAPIWRQISALPSMSSPSLPPYSMYFSIQDMASSISHACSLLSSPSLASSLIATLSVGHAKRCIHGLLAMLAPAMDAHYGSVKEGQ